MKEEPYTAEEIENIIDENLSSLFSSNPAYLNVIKVAKQYKLHQVLISPSSEVNFILFVSTMSRYNLGGVWFMKFFFPSKEKEKAGKEN